MSGRRQQPASRSAVEARKLEYDPHLIPNKKERQTSINHPKSILHFLGVYHGVGSAADALQLGRPQLDGIT